MKTSRPSRLAAIVLVCGCALSFCPPALFAEDEAPAVARRHPLLDQLNRETRALYDDVRQSVVPAQLPPQQWMENYVRNQNPLKKYPNLTPEVRQELERRVRRAPEPEALAVATNLPSTHLQSDAEGRGGTYIVVPPSRPSEPAAAADPVPGGRLCAEFQTAPAAGSTDASAAAEKPFAPDNIGVVLDDRGHVLIPLYVERDAETDPPLIRIAVSGGNVLAAQFVGSDRQTNLTVAKLDKAPGRPARLGGEKPADGSLVMSISPADASGRLVVWNGGTQENGLVFTSDGEMAGVARFGQFLTGSACRLIADQIIRHGSVKRATLGVIISEIRENDPLRQQLPVLGTRTAMRIDQVMAGSAAEKAGLKGGDLVVALAGEAVSDIPSFAAAIAAKTGKTELQLVRSGQLLRITVELQAK